MMRELVLPMEFRDVDIRATGCGCAMNCFTQFTMKHYLATRANTQQLHRKELDMVLMEQLMAFTFCSQAPQNASKHRHQPKQRERCSTTMVFGCARRHFCFFMTLGIAILRPLGLNTSQKEWSPASMVTLAVQHIMHSF